MMDHSASQPNRIPWPLFLSASLLLGAALRLSFPGDIEYKGDEQYMFGLTQTIGISQPWPVLGMVSGGQVKNPGMSIWVLAALARVTHAATPPELARAVQSLNILGLLALFFFSARILPEPERRPWYWAAAMASVSPVAVLFQRKIWAQSTLPFFCVLFWMAWHYRRKRTGAFFWGLLGICLGQIHLSGFYLMAGVFLWTAFRDREARWGFWLAGTLVGALPLIPWVPYVLSNSDGGFGLMNLYWLLFPKYWIYWVTDSLGMGLTHSMKAPGFLDFLRYPSIGPWGIYWVGALHLLILIAAVRIFTAAGKTAKSRQGVADHSETALALNATLWAAGFLMTLSCFKINQHYLIMTFPMEWVWLSRLGLRDTRWGERCLGAIWAAQLLISAAFLAYIHAHHGVPLGDYGTAYQFQ
jgi:hypothetical protein